MNSARNLCSKTWELWSRLVIILPMVIADTTNATNQKRRTVENSGREKCGRERTLNYYILKVRKLRGFIFRNSSTTSTSRHFSNSYSVVNKNCQNMSSRTLLLLSWWTTSSAKNSTFHLSCNSLKMRLYSPSGKAPRTTSRQDNLGALQRASCSRK